MRSLPKSSERPPPSQTEPEHDTAWKVDIRMAGCPAAGMPFSMAHDHPVATAHADGLARRLGDAGDRCQSFRSRDDVRCAGVPAETDTATP